MAAPLANVGHPLPHGHPGVGCPIGPYLGQDHRRHRHLALKFQPGLYKLLELQRVTLLYSLKLNLKLTKRCLLQPQ